MKHELSPVPTSLFLETGDMRPTKSKSILKNSLQVEVSNRNFNVDVAIIDGCAILWSCYWPVKGTVRDLAEVFFQYVKKKLSSHDVYLIFYR